LRHLTHLSQTATHLTHYVRDTHSSN